MSFRVIITPTADAEALESLRWYADRSHAAAQRWYAGLKRTMERLSEKPDRFPVSPEDSEALGYEVRMLLHGRRRGTYRILFTISDDTVWVLRIRHNARGPIEP